MDRRAHRRFLDYLEKYDYFRPPGVERLTRERWQASDTEHGELLEKKERSALTAAELMKLTLLRRLLLRG